MSGKRKKVGRVSPLRAVGASPKTGAHGVTRPTSELREEPPPYHVNGNGQQHKFRFIDLFCGIGGFRIAFERAGCECVFSYDWNEKAQETYAANFGEWACFRYLNEQLVPFDAISFFGKWVGNRGRANINKKVWDEDVNARFRDMDDADVTAMVTAQAFYYGFLKVKLRKPFNDPYDVDCFVASHQGTVLPVEIKEKSAGGGDGDSFFGIDAGRILMLLRLCLPVDANAAYVVREVREGGSREFLGWKVLTLDRLIMSASWNLQAGGVGMGGGNTQTVLMP